MKYLVKYWQVYLLLLKFAFLFDWIILECCLYFAMAVKAVSLMSSDSWSMLLYPDTFGFLTILEIKLLKTVQISVSFLTILSWSTLLMLFFYLKWYYLSELQVIAKVFHIQVIIAVSFTFFSKGLRISFFAYYIFVWFLLPFLSKNMSKFTA